MATEATRLNEIKDFWESSEREHSNFLERFRENFRFAVGGDQQWLPEDIARLNNEELPHITYNEILPKLNALIGENLENLFDIKVFARRGGTVTASNVLTALGKHAIELCKGDYEESDAFLNGLIGGIGVLHWLVNFEDDPFNGDVKVVSRWPANVMFDESNRHYDANKGKFVFDLWWWDIEQLKLAYPDKAKDIVGGGLDTDPNDPFFARRSFYAEPTVESDYGQPGEGEMDSPEELPIRSGPTSC